MEIIFVIIIFTVSIIYVVQPLFLNDVQSESKLFNSESQHQEKSILYKQIKELELDYDLGNISKEDFKQIRSQLKKEVSIIIETSSR